MNLLLQSSLARYLISSYMVRAHIAQPCWHVELSLHVSLVVSTPYHPEALYSSLLFDLIAPGVSAWAESSECLKITEPPCLKITEPTTKWLTSSKCPAHIWSLQLVGRLDIRSAGRTCPARKEKKHNPHNKEKTTRAEKRGKPAGLVLAAANVCYPCRRCSTGALITCK